MCHLVRFIRHEWSFFFYCKRTKCWMQTLLLERSIPAYTGNEFSMTYLGNIILKTTCLIHVSARELNSLQLGECVILHAVVALRLWFQAAQHRATLNLPRCTGQLPAKKNRTVSIWNHHWQRMDEGRTMDGRSEFEVARREHEEGSKMAQKGLSIDSDISRFIVKILRR